MNHEFFASDVSDSFGGFDACKKCGVTWDEAIFEAGLADIGRHRSSLPARKSRCRIGN